MKNEISIQYVVFTWQNVHSALSDTCHSVTVNCVLGPAWWRASKSVGGLSKQPGEAHLLHGEVDTCELRHAGVSSLFVGSKASNDITLYTHSS